MNDVTTEEAQRLEVSARARSAAIDLLVLKGLYSVLDVSDEVGREAESKIRDANIGTFDCYCVGCKKETPFIVAPMPVQNAGGGLRQRTAVPIPPSVFALRAVCQRDLSTYLYAFRKVGDRLIKIGQQPSMADISFGELRGIDKTLDSVDRKELGKAIGLFAHDAASGAFVYLRRVFERMIARAYSRQAEIHGPIEGFDGMRVDQKIAALKDELPERVVRNSAVFSLLSVGIHELTDDQCLTLFPVLKAVIFQMLEQEEHKRKKEITERETDAAFQALLSTGTSRAVGSDAALTTDEPTAAPSDHDHDDRRPI